MLLINGNVFIDGHFEFTDIKLKDGLITEVGPDLAPSEGEQIIDCTGLKVIPGLFDIHTHGCLGHDFSIPDREGDLEMCRYYAEHGVTSILATTMTNEPGQYTAACRVIGDLIIDAAGSPAVSAHIRGINAEGPFLSPDKRGAHDPRYIRPVSQEFFDTLNEASGGTIRLMTVAPELDGALEFIRRNTARPVVPAYDPDADPAEESDDPAELSYSDAAEEPSAPSGLHIAVGHSACDYDMAFTAFDYGADHVTHLFNAMNGLGHRSPGIPGAAFDRGAYTELICDGLHVHPATVRMMFRCFPDRLVLISDSINPTGLPEGSYTAGGLEVFMRDGEIRLADGTLAGSSITLFEGLRRVISFGVPEEQAILAATYNPAASLGMQDRVGSIAVGRSAELLLVTRSWEIDSVIINDTVFCKNM